MVRLLALVLLALAPAAAIAGTRATYVDEHGQRRVILIADNGDFEVQLWMGQHLIVKSGRAYVIEEQLTGPLVTSLNELVAASAELAAVPRPPPSAEQEAAMADAVRTMEAAAADIEALAAQVVAEAQAAEGSAVSQNDQPHARLPRTWRDGIVVNGRPGRGHYYRRVDDNVEEIFAVISNDPALAPIGAAFFRAIEAELELERASGTFIPARGPMDPEDIRILTSGTPIQYYSSRLREVEPVVLPAIALPAEPETGAEVRTRLAAERAARFAPSPPERNASRALFAGGRLYLVTGDHQLASVAEGETALTRHDLGEPVLDACVQGGAPLALTGAAENPSAWTVRRLQGGQWRAERTVASDGDAPVALACTPEGAFLLTSHRFIDLTPARPVALRLQGEPVHALVTAAVHVTPQAVFVGLNAGEWGGGLRRVDRRSGRIETIARNATGDLCDGPLNPDCDPVQGLATIPWRPDCIAAAIGLIHMAAHGRVTMVCPGRIEQLYAATRGEFEDPERAREAARGRYGSIAFFGLAASGNGLIAIGHNGLYRLAADGTATHVPLPRFVRVEGVLVSFALPDAVLVVTGINGRASVSGAVPIMAVRQ